MATIGAVLQVAAVLLAVTVTTSLAGRKIWVRGFGHRNRQQNSCGEVLQRIDQLTSLVNDLQGSVEEIHETVNDINATVDPRIVSQL